MRNSILTSLLIAGLSSFVLEGNAQLTTTVTSEMDVGAAKPARKYAVGLMALSRIPVVNINYGFDEFRWSLYGGGVSLLRYSSNRTFWSAGFAYAVTPALNKQRILDIRISWDTLTNSPIQSELGTRTEVWKYSYYNVPIAFHHLLTKLKKTNLYVTGGVTLDWMRLNVREVTATYDGRFDILHYGDGFSKYRLPCRAGWNCTNRWARTGS